MPASPLSRRSAVPGQRKKESFYSMSGNTEVLSDNKQKKKTVREKVRILEIFYDIIIFGVLFSVFFLGVKRHFTVIDMTSRGVMLHLLLTFVLLAAFRSLLNVYKQVIRYGNLSAFSRLYLADSIAAVLYAVINRMLPLGYRIFAFSAPAFIFGNLMVCILARMLYYYIFRIAQREDRIGRSLTLLLRRFALVDPRSEEVAATLSVREWLKAGESDLTDPINEIQRIAMKFRIRGDVTEIRQIKKGYINRTYRIRTLSNHGHYHWYTLQRINTNVFPDVDALMQNFALVSAHLHDRMLLPGHTERGSIQMLKLTVDGKPYYKDDSGCWRMLTHFTEVYGMDIPDSPTSFYWAGQSFGSFIRYMSDVPPSDIKVVIPNFHNTPSRYNDLEKVIEKDPVGRLKDVWDEVEFIRRRKDRFGLISEALENGEIPTRVCHNDCNLNNILFSEKTHLPVAIIDLDTVMPSSPLYDFGDSMRVGTNTARDDEQDLSKVSCDLKLYESYARGYLEACGSLLTEKELELLPFAALIVTSEDGIRFLADHLAGDVYYNIFYPGQNLDRARTQLKLLEDMEKKLPEIREILSRIYKSLGLDADPFAIK